MQDWYDSSAANDRFVFALLMALVMHAAVILGVGFEAPEALPPATSLDVTLAPFRSDEAPEQPDFLSPTNQLGGGEAARPTEASSPVASELNSAAVQELLRDPAAGTGSVAPPAAAELLRATRSADTTAPNEEQAPEPADVPGSAVAPGAMDVSSLIARLQEQSRAYARRPRVERLTSVSARAAEDAEYLLAWTERVERIGNLNYPDEARRRQLYGDLRLLVALRPDGGVADVRVLQSSGQPVLDRAAVRIVHLSAPFPALPPAMRQRTDLLEVIRTWRFRADQLRTGD